MFHFGHDLEHILNILNETAVFSGGFVENEPTYRTIPDYTHPNSPPNSRHLLVGATACRLLSFRGTTLCCQMMHEVSCHNSKMEYLLEEYLLETIIHKHRLRNDSFNIHRFDNHHLKEEPKSSK